VVRQSAATTQVICVGRPSLQTKDKAAAASRNRHDVKAHPTCSSRLFSLPRDLDELVARLYCRVNIYDYTTEWRPAHRFSCAVHYVYWKLFLDHCFLHHPPNIEQTGSQNAIYHQRQAILRNSDTSAVPLWRLLRMPWSWRKRTLTATTRHNLWSLALSLTSFSAFAIAGVFSSKVATSRGGEVLILGDKCATLNKSLFTDENVGLTQTYLDSRVKSSVNYASSCYSNSGFTDSCRIFVETTLPLTVTRKISCPFSGKDRICHSPGGAVRLDSEFLNSHFDLGINSPPSMRFPYRTVNECAPLRSEGYTYNSTSGSRKTMQFWYGGDWQSCKKHRDGYTYELNAETEAGPDARNKYSLSYVALVAKMFLQLTSRIG
jgi:hypothetical protein